MIQDKIQNRDTCHLIYSSFKIQQESKALAAKLEAEKNALAAQLETGNKEVAERMQKEEEQRKREADEMKVIVFDISMLLTYNNPPLNQLPGNMFLFSFSF